MKQNISAQFGLIGKALTHSFSPRYFNERFAAQHLNLHYQAFPIESIDLLPALLAGAPQLQGLNVTIPYKTAVIPYLQGISEEARNIGAVNCIRILEGKLYGYNTDVYGFTESLRPLLKKDHQQALILGNGGAAKAVKAGLRALSIPFRTVSRSGTADYTYDQLDAALIAGYPLLINTTPLGMFPDTASAPAIPYEAIGSRHLLYDLIYNPAETRFLQLGKARGAATKNGNEMLLLQAERSWDLWTGIVSEPIVRV